eukprot:COSAG02_NODE_13303_length_1408_cov_2.479817_2_plen_175_part_00
MAFAESSIHSHVISSRSTVDVVQALRASITRSLGSSQPGLRTGSSLQPRGSSSESDTSTACAQGCQPASALSPFSTLSLQLPLVQHSLLSVPVAAHRCKRCANFANDGPRTERATPAAAEALRRPRARVGRRGVVPRRPGRARAKTLQWTLTSQKATILLLQNVVVRPLLSGLL